LLCDKIATRSPHNFDADSAEFLKRNYRGCIRVLEGEAAMGPARPQNKRDRQLDSQPLAGQEPVQESVQESVDVLSLIDENARLRGLVVKLSELVLKNVLDKEDR
jgi:hypothetical protein